MASDVLGVNKPQFSSSVGESADDPGVRKDAIAKLQQMRKHLTFVQMYISALEQALRSPGTLKTLQGRAIEKAVARLGPEYCHGGGTDRNHAWGRRRRGAF